MRLNPFRRSSRRHSSSAYAVGWLRPETKRAIFGVAFIVIALIILLSFFGAAGPTGAFIYMTLRRMTGFLAYILPFGLLGWGVYLIRPREEALPRLQMVGIGLVAVGLLGLFHSIGVSLEDAYQTALEGKGGGLIGFMLAFPLIQAFSSIAAILIFLATTIAGSFLAINQSPAEVWAYIKGFIPTREPISDAGEDIYAGEEEPTPILPSFRISRRVGGSAEPDPKQLKLAEEQAAREQEEKDRQRALLKAANKQYVPPSTDILHASIGKPEGGNVEANKKKIQTTLEKFGINVSMGKVSIGPTVTQYTLRPDEGVKLARIMALQNDLALALAAHPIRIEAPIPNTNMVGIEIPNKDVSLVRLKDLVVSKEFKAAQTPLTIGMGKDVMGHPHMASIESMPHMLVAGATGSGKSVFINTMILSLLYRNSPAVVRLILVDPKRVELTPYNGIPHLLTPVITEPDKTINALKWAVKEMDRRYRLLADSGSRNLMSYNTSNPDSAMPLIVFVIDELADLMSTHARDVEGMIVRLAQMARAIGIHLVLATQRPSVNVITGIIKANVPTRVAFNVASQIDSRTILDGAGAEKLLGSGDMLFLRGDQAKPIRLQGSFVSEEEVRQVVEDIREKNPVENEHDTSITAPQRSMASDGGAEPIDDDLFEDAKQVVIQSGKASASLLQRRLRVGYARAARLIDMLEENGIISEAEGNKPREILAQSEAEEEDTYEDRSVPVGNEPYEDNEPVEDSDTEEEGEEDRWQ